MKAIINFIYILVMCGWLGAAVLPFFDIEYHPVIISMLCINMALTFARWAAE